jgi:fermentation-respiration switch protein FrsA (DUF1100 family)
MKKLFSICIVVTLFLFGGCQMDDFLFNEKAITRYELPGNDIPDSLIKQAIFYSGGNKLYGYWVASSKNYSGKTILYCHGNKNNIDNYWDRVMLLHKLGVNVFVFDFRGFGMSEGQSSETGLHEDGIAAYNYIKNNYSVTSDALYLYGYSLGNVVSIYLAAEAVNPAGLIAESPFASANSLTQGSLILDIPSGWLTEGKFDNADEIKKIKTPLLLIHGSDDDFVRFKDNGQIVYNNAPEPKQLILVQGATHTNVPQVMGTDNYLSALRSFMGIGIRK